MYARVRGSCGLSHFVHIHAAAIIVTHTTTMILRAVESDSGWQAYNCGKYERYTLNIRRRKCINNNIHVCDATFSDRKLNLRTKTTTTSCVAAGNRVRTNLTQTHGLPRRIRGMCGDECEAHAIRVYRFVPQRTDVKRQTSVHFRWLALPSIDAHEMTRRAWTRSPDPSDFVGAEAAAAASLAVGIVVCECGWHRQYTSTRTQTDRKARR